jgi:hypothetical protein
MGTNGPSEGDLIVRIFTTTNTNVIERSEVTQVSPTTEETWRCNSTSPSVTEEVAQRTPKTLTLV